MNPACIDGRVKSCVSASYSKMLQVSRVFSLSRRLGTGGTLVGVRQLRTSTRVSAHMMYHVKHMLIPVERSDLQKDVMRRIQEAPRSNLEDLLDEQTPGSSEPSTDDIGWLDPDLAPPEVKAALLKANKGGDAVTCTTELGLHVFQVLDTRDVPDIHQLPVEEFAGRLLTNDGKMQLVDVREEWEAATASIPGFKLLPLSRAVEWEGHITELFDLSKPIYCLCHHGVRSQRMAQLLQNKGFQDVYNIVGGIDAYSKQVDQSIPLY